MTYLEGELELMSPSRSREWLKTTLARLIEAWANEERIPLVGFGSWTVRSAPAERGLEPDECYALSERHDRPDLAVEVVWTTPAVGKLEVYCGLGVPEVWIWRKAFARFLGGSDQAAAVFGFLDWLRGRQ